jgi:hypothetical protein
MTRMRSADPNLAEEILFPREPAHDRTVVMADPGGPPIGIWRWVSARQAWAVDVEHLARVHGQRVELGRDHETRHPNGQAAHTRPRGWRP